MERRAREYICSKSESGSDVGIKGKSESKDYKYIDKGFTVTSETSILILMLLKVLVNVTVKCK